MEINKVDDDLIKALESLCLVFKEADSIYKLTRREDGNYYLSTAWVKESQLF